MIHSGSLQVGAAPDFCNTCPLGDEIHPVEPEVAVTTHICGVPPRLQVFWPTITFTILIVAVSDSQGHYIIPVYRRGTRACRGSMICSRSRAWYVAQRGFESRLSSNSALTTWHALPSPKRPGKGWSRQREGRAGKEGLHSYRSVFILQAGAGDWCSRPEGCVLGRGHFPTPLELVV